MYFIFMTLCIRNPNAQWSVENTTLNPTCLATRHAILCCDRSRNQHGSSIEWLNIVRTTAIETESFDFRIIVVPSFRELSNYMCHLSLSNFIAIDIFLWHFSTKSSNCTHSYYEFSNEFFFLFIFSICWMWDHYFVHTSFCENEHWIFGFSAVRFP